MHGHPFSEMDSDGFFPVGYPMGTHWISISFHGKTFFFIKTVSIFTLNNTTLGVGEFWEKGPLGSILDEHLLLELPGPQALTRTLWSMDVYAYVIGALATSFTTITGSYKVRYTKALPFK